MKPFSGMPDQYYAVTSRLTAQGDQPKTMRVVAGCILLLGLPPSLASTNPHSSVWSKGTWLFLFLAVGTLALAAPWLRYRWPSREVSLGVISIGSVALAVGCGVATDPLAGLLISTAFLFIVMYAALFHSTWVAAVAAAISAATMLFLTVRIAADNLATALAVATPVVLLNVAVLFGGRTVARLNDANDTRTDIEPLTGLLNREGFDEMVATLLGARNRRDDRYLVIAIATIDTLAPMHGSRGADLARVAVSQALRGTVRRDALVAHVGEAEFLVADTFTIPNPRPLAERILGAVAATPEAVTVSIGVVCTPLRPLADRPPNEVLDELIALATTAMYRARGRGGGQAEYVIQDWDR